MTGDAFDWLIAPSDGTLSALIARFDATDRRDESLAGAVADRLDELACPALAAFWRLLAAKLLYERSVFDALARSFGVPAHLLSLPNGELPFLSDSQTVLAK